MVEPNQQQDPNSLLPAQGAAPGAAPAGPGGALANGGLDSMVAGYLQHITDVQKQSPLGQAVAAAKSQAAQAASQPVDTTKPPAPPASDDASSPAPGSFGDKLPGATGGGLRDAAHAHDTKGGWLSGLLNTANARNKRLQEEQNNQMLHAKTQAETLALHRNLYNQSEQIRQAGYKGGQDFTEQYRQNHDIKENVNHTELANLMKDPKFVGEHYIRAVGEEPVLDTKGEPKLDADGEPVTHPMYNIITKATKDGSVDDKTVTSEMSTDAKKYTNYAYPPGTKLTTDQHASVDTAINLARTSTNVVNESREKPLTDEEMKSLKPYLTDPTIQAAVSHVPGSAYAGLLEYLKNADAHIAQQQQIMQATTAQNAAASATVDQRLQNITGAVTNQQAYQTAKQQVADLTDEKNKVANFTAAAIDAKQVKDYNTQQQKSNGIIGEIAADPTKMQGKTEATISAANDVIKNSTDQNVIAQATRVRDMALDVQARERKEKVDTAVETETAKANAARVDNNPNGLTGPAFIATLPPGRANMLRSMAEGRLVVNPSAFERSTGGKPNQLADDMYAAYPDFNATLGAEWPKAWANYMINGQDHKKTVAFNTVLEHAQRLYDNTTMEGVTNPNSKAYQDREEEKSFVARELGNAVSTGVLAQSEAEDVRKALETNWPTLEAKKERVREAVKLLDSKINAIQDSFNANAPSAQMPVPRLMSAGAKAAHDHVLGQDQQGGANAPAAKPQQGPKGGFNPQVSADGKTTIWQLGNQWVTADGKPYKP